MKLHFRKKTLDVLVPVQGSGYEVRPELYHKYLRCLEEYKLIQQMFTNIEKHGKPENK